MAKLRIPTAAGNLVEVAGILTAAYILAIAPKYNNVPLKLVLYLIAWGCLLFFPHSLAHYVVGTLVGVRFRYYSIGKSSAYKLKAPVLSTIASKSVVLTLHVERSQLGSVARGRLVAMFCSGAAASMVFPFVAVLASFGNLPAMFSVLLLLISIGNVIFDLYFSPMVGDVSRAISVR
jgi:hypothetical protein